MSDKDITQSYERSAGTMRGDNTTFGTKLTKEDSNDPNTHSDLHNRIQVDYTRFRNLPLWKMFISGKENI